MSKKHPLSAFERFQIIQPFLENEVSLSNIANHYGYHISTLKRWIKKYRELGLSGLDRKKRADKGKRQQITEELEQLAEALILNKPPISLAAIHRKVSQVAKTKGQIVPSYRVIWDVAQKIDPALVVLAHQGSKSYNQEYELVFRREASTANEIWQADHTPLDIVLLDEKGDIRKPWLTTIIDDYSRGISGYLLFIFRCSLFHQYSFSASTSHLEKG